MEIKEIFILTYLIGYVLSYLIIKFVRNKQDANDWDDIFRTILFSLFSWIGFIIIFCFEFKDICKILNININIKPPKWL